jgi:hypothetical protein
VNSRSLFPALLLIGLLSGCHGHPSLSATASAASNNQQREALESQRQELDMIPPPSKTRYLSVHNLDEWENPYITVQPDMVTLHVIIADANPTTMGLGGMTRPENARRQSLNVSLDRLGEALSSIPQDAWPYGRVTAVEEAHNTPAAGRPQVRRTMETTMKTLGDLGIVVYEWNESGSTLK